MSNKVLVVGLNPSNRWLTGKIYKNCTIDKLNFWMYQCGVDYYSFINTYDTPEKSNIDYSMLRSVSKDYDKVIALGKEVSKTLDKARIKHFAMPHPSPRNRNLNDKTYEGLMILACNTYLKGRL